MGTLPVIQPGRADRPAPSPRRTLVMVAVIGVLVHLAFLGLAVRATGRIDGFAYRSVDGEEFMRLAQSLARHGAFSQDQAPPFFPDTWRCPAYPLLLAGCVRLTGDGTAGAVLLQQILAVCSVCLLVRIASRWTSRRWAVAVGVLWLLDPYRGYYSLWILSVTWFVLLLLLAAQLWQHWWMGRRSVWLAGVLGAVAGLVVLTRPIALVLIPLVLLATAAAAGKGRHRLARTLACLSGVLIVVGPWVIRNKVVAGRFALSHQAGTVLTYYKGLEVVLWARGQADRRYDLDAVHAVWEEFDRSLRARWSAAYGPLTGQAERDVAWPQIAWGRVRSVSPLVLDRETLGLGWAVLTEHPWATATCWAWRCGSILTFPLNLAICPPDDMGALPFAALLPHCSVPVRRAFAAMLAAPFLGLTVVAGWRAVRLVRARQFVVVATCALPVVAMLVAASPQLDPRFRIPMIPFLLLLVAARANRPTSGAAPSARRTLRRESSSRRAPSE